VKIRGETIFVAKRGRFPKGASLRSPYGHRRHAMLVIKGESTFGARSEGVGHGYGKVETQNASHGELAKRLGFRLARPEVTLLDASLEKGDAPGFDMV
jgi:hypothetical protein